MAQGENIMQKLILLRERYYKHAFKKASLIDLLSEAEVSEQVYNSNAIENSTLTFDETQKILQQIDLDRFISERELFETKNLSRVIGYLNVRAKEKELDIEMILLLHKMLLSNINDNIVGRFRSENEWVKVGNHIAVDPKKVYVSVEDMLIKYYGTVHLNIVKRISLLHLTFEHIHPFVDGNGRIGRVINNFLLIREGYVPINIKFIDRGLYYDAFEEFDNNEKTTIMEDIVGKALTNSYHKRLAYLEEKQIISLKEYAKLNNTSHSNIINKAKRQSIEAFTEKGIWKIGI
ncbi:MAG: Fic family protein [Bacteroidales bacterium]|nr:Fic family protein [Bacteroidales bacterium]